MHKTFEGRIPGLFLLGGEGRDGLKLVHPGVVAHRTVRDGGRVRHLHSARVPAHHSQSD